MRTDRRWTWRLRAAGVALGAIFACLLVSTPLAQAQQNRSDAGVDSVFVGMSVCMDSVVYGYHCARVTALNQTVCFPDRCVYGLAQSSLRSGPGDQGRLVYRISGQVVGTVVGGNSAATWFDPI